MSNIGIPDTLGGVSVASDTITVTPIVAGATAVAVVANNGSRKTLTLLNDGTNDAYYGFANTVTASTGMPLYAGGGGFSWGLGEADPRAIYVFSTAGTTIKAKEGV